MADRPIVSEVGHGGGPDNVLAHVLGESVSFVTIAMAIA